MALLAPTRRLTAKGRALTPVTPHSFLLYDEISQPRPKEHIVPQLGAFPPTWSPPSPLRDPVFAFVPRHTLSLCTCDEPHHHHSP